VYEINLERSAEKDLKRLPLGIFTGLPLPDPQGFALSLDAFLKSEQLKRD
jgi:hypothetical protein